MPIPLDGMRTCTSGIRAHCASVYTTRVGPPRVSRNKHFRHSPTISIVKQSCMKTLQLLSAGPRRQASARTSAESDEACQRKTKDRADGMREKSAHSPRRDSNLYLWDMRPSCFRLHHEGRPASHQSKQTLQTLTHQLHRETIMHETLQLQSAVCVCARVSTISHSVFAHSPHTVLICCTGHGVCRPDQGMHHCSTESHGSRSRCSCRVPVEVPHAGQCSTVSGVHTAVDILHLVDINLRAVANCWHS